MASLENKVIELDTKYYELLSELKNNIDDKNNATHYKNVGVKELTKYLHDILGYQKYIESVINEIIINYKTINLERLKNYYNELNNLFTIEKSLFEFSYTPLYYSSSRDSPVYGCIVHLKRALTYYQRNDLDQSNRNCYAAYLSFENLLVYLIDLEEELRFISLLTGLPINNKLKLKNKLLKEGLNQVAFRLDEADANIASNHKKDVISRCRDSLEHFFVQIIKKELKKESSMHFNDDVKSIIDLGIYDESVQRLVMGVYSYLSLKGSHDYSEEKISIYDVETALEYTYSVIENLLLRYDFYQKQKLEKI